VLHESIAEAESERRRLEAQHAAEQDDEETPKHTLPLPKFGDSDYLDLHLEELRDQLSEEREAREAREARDDAWLSGELSVQPVPELTGGTAALSAQQVFANRMRVQRATRGML